ncbi:MAG: putative F420-dependent oxidoreductase [Candidatus Azotimanducaceae bacterium]|jgi:probable F420-dependent oxidoreductase
MTTATSTTARDRLSTTGVWYFTDGMSSGQAAEAAGRIESLGYSTLWLPDTIGRDPFAHIAWLASQTTTLQYATGIANIFHRHPGPMKQAANTLAEQTGGRFVLGLGVSHGPMVAGLRGLDYSKPLTKMQDYLAAMETQPYRGIAPEDEPLVLLAALGPKMLELSASAADGAHPYWTTPEHTAMAREAIGPDALLCVEQKVVFTTDADAARAAGNQQIDRYAALPNYRNNWIRLGFTEEEIEQRDHRFVDAVVVWGDEDRVRAGVQAHYDAGADHVCVQPINPDMSADIEWNVLELLAPS